MSAIHAPMFTSGDPYWGSVVLLAHFDGNLTDQKGHTLSAVSAENYAAEAKYGSHSKVINYNTTGEYVRTPVSSDFDFSSGNFTVEAWVYATSFGVPFVICGAFTNPTGYRFYLNNNQLSFQIISGVEKYYNFSSLASALNRWVYVKAVKIGTSFYLQMDDTSSGDLGNIGAVVAPNTGYFNLGRDEQGNWTGIGYLDEVRITKGVGRSITSMPTKAFPNS